MSQRCLQLVLEAGQVVPAEFCWLVKQGYVGAISWSEQGDLIPLGLWGPGELLIPHSISIQPVELRACSAITVREYSRNALESDAFVAAHIQQMSMLFRLSRIRPAERRLFILLKWLGERFGQESQQGVRLPLGAMNLTHRNLGDLCSMTRVTVTKTLGHFRQQGWLQSEGGEELLTRSAITEFEQCE